MTPHDLKTMENFFHTPDKHFSDDGVLLWQTIKTKVYLMNLLISLQNQTWHIPCFTTTSYVSTNQKIQTSRKSEYGDSHYQYVSGKCMGNPNPVAASIRQLIQEVPKPMTYIFHHANANHLTHPLINQSDKEWKILLRAESIIFASWPMISLHM